MPLTARAQRNLEVHDLRLYSRVGKQQVARPDTRSRSGSDEEKKGKGEAGDLDA